MLCPERDREPRFCGVEKPRSPPLRQDFSSIPGSQASTGNSPLSRSQLHSWRESTKCSRCHLV